MKQLFEIHSYVELLEFIVQLEKDTVSVDDVLADLKKPTAINHIRGIVISAEGIAKLPEILDKLDVILSKINMPLPQSLNDAEIGNLAFFTPTYFWRNIPYFSKSFSSFGYHASSVFLARSGNLEKLLVELNENKNIELSPTFAMQSAFRATVNQCENEQQICLLLAERMVSIPGTSIVKTALAQRRNNIKNQNTLVPILKSKPRVALLICGQCRDIERMLPIIAQQYKLSELDVYISTWKMPGTTPIDRARLTRRVVSDAIDDIKLLYTDKELEIIATHELSQMMLVSNSLEKALQTTFKDANSLSIFLADDTDIIYRTMDNHQKMYFHNAYWIRKLGKDYFESNYDVLIKTRPDIVMDVDEIISPSSVQNIDSNIRCDHPTWLYETWGFGAGDQLFFGLTSNMLPLLDIQYPKNLSTRLLSEVFHLGKMFQGHMNIGIEMWLNGIKPVPAPIVKKGLASEKKMTFEQFVLLAEQAGIKKK